MSVQLINTCQRPRPLTRDALASLDSYIVLFGDGTDESRYQYPSGKLLSFPNSTIAQNESRVLGGLSKPNTYRKDCCNC